MVQSVHNFLDTGDEVPPMDVQYVNVCCAELFQGGFNRNMHGFHAIAGVVYLIADVLVEVLEIGSVLKLTTQRGPERQRRSCEYNRLGQTFVAMTS